MFEKICVTYSHWLALNFCVVSVQCESVGGILMGLVSIHQESLHKPGGYTLSASKNKKTAAVLLALSNSRVTEKNNFYGLRGSTFCCHGTSTERSASVNWCKFNLAHKFLLRPLFFAATKRMRRPAHMLIHRSGMRCCAIARPSCLRWPPPSPRDETFIQPPWWSFAGQRGGQTTNKSTQQNFG